MTVDVLSTLLSELVALHGATLEDARKAVADAGEAVDAIPLHDGPERDAVLACWARRLVVERKCCVDCGEPKPWIAFYAAQRGAVDRRQSRCIPCDNAARSARVAEERERLARRGAA
jgi:hypothetical protein